MASSATIERAEVSPECVKDYKDLKTKRKYKFMTIKIEDETFRLVTDDKGKKDDTLDAFLKALPRSKCRYAIYDQQFKNGEGRIIEKLFYIVWTPGAAQSREKILYSSQKFATTDNFTGVEEVQASSKEDLRKMLLSPAEQEESGSESSDSD